MSATPSPTPTLNGKPISSPRQSKAFPNSTMESCGLAQKERVEREAEDTSDLRPAEGPRAKIPAPEKFAHTVFDSKIAQLQKIYTKIMLTTLTSPIVMMWICLPVYWGSLARSANHAPSLKTWVIDREGGEIGQAVVQDLWPQLSGTKQHLGWRQIPADQVADVGEAIVDEQAWGAVIINAGASARLAAARASGDPSYNPATAITFYYA